MDKVRYAVQVSYIWVVPEPITQYATLRPHKGNTIEALQQSIQMDKKCGHKRYMLNQGYRDVSPKTWAKREKAQEFADLLNKMTELDLWDTYDGLKPVGLKAKVVEYKK